MPTIADKSVDLILCDLPYGTTENKWDSIIPLNKLWNEYKRICKGSTVLTAAQPFSSTLVMSNLMDFRYEWVWLKSTKTNFLNAHKQPLRQHEIVLVFGGREYYPQNYQKYTNYPTSLLQVASEGKKQHPTQKPVALMEYLIKTYTTSGAVVLDNCMGSGTTGVACKNLGRSFIGIEKDPEYFQIAQERIGEYI